MFNRQRVIQQSSTVLAGEINAHSIRWNPRCQAQWHAAFWESVIDQNGLEIGNDGKATLHWTRECHEGEWVIKLTLANQRVPKWSILADNHATGFDHDVIEWVVEVARQEQGDHEMVIGWTFAAMAEEDTESAEELCMGLTIVRAHLDAECTADEVQQEAAWCPEAMVSILDATTQKI